MVAVGSDVEVPLFSVVIAASSAALSAAPFSVGVVSFVILIPNLASIVAEIIQSDGWSGHGARIRRNEHGRSSGTCGGQLG